MDPAQVLVQSAFSNQNAMNAVIDRFDSPVQQFYRDSTVFVTGGTGFLGKQLLEKLFRSCKIKKVILLMRPKKGKSIKERLDYILKDTVYESLHQKQADFVGRIVAVEGDTKEVRLGMSDKDWDFVKKEADVIFHLAATVRFDEPLRTATLINVRGTVEALQLAQQCTKLKKFVYVSTAYAHATYSHVDNKVLEQFYPSPVAPGVMIGLAETLEEERLDRITPELISNWPNTYTFTKAIAEEAVRTLGAGLPACIVRPPIVLCSYREPNPGWLDMSCLFGPTGVVFGVSLGVLRVFMVDIYKRLAFAPVDYVNNAIIAAGWDSDERNKDGEKDIPIYSVANINSCITWEFLHDTMAALGYKSFTPKAVWFCYLLEIRNKYIFSIMTWLLHLIPAYIIDGVDAVLKIKPKGVPSFVSIYDKVGKMAQVFEFFLYNEWHFKDSNTIDMMNRMSPADRAIYNCDMSTVDRKTFVELWMMGTRKYLIKDGLEGSVKGAKKQKMLKYVNFVVTGLYLFAILYILSKVVSSLVWFFFGVSLWE